jgi:hypothetical protein
MSDAMLLGSLYVSLSSMRGEGADEGEVDIIIGCGCRGWRGERGGRM